MLFFFFFTKHNEFSNSGKCDIIEPSFLPFVEAKWIGKNKILAISEKKNLEAPIRIKDCVCI